MWKKRATEEQVTGKLSRTVFKKSPELYGQPGAFSGQGIVTKNDAMAIGIEVTATPYMQHHLAAAGRIVVNDTRLGEAVGDKAKVLTLAVVALIKVDVKDLGVKYVQFMRRLVIVCLFHTHHVKPVQNTLWEEVTGQ
jgi:hypothetical protein